MPEILDRIIPFLADPLSGRIKVRMPVSNRISSRNSMIGKISCGSDEAMISTVKFEDTVQETGSKEGNTRERVGSFYQALRVRQVLNYLTRLSRESLVGQGLRTDAWRLAVMLRRKAEHVSKYLFWNNSASFVLF